MGRPRLPADALGFRYEPGPPKRIRVSLRLAGGDRVSASLSTRDARLSAALLIEAIDTAEADKIATRGDPTQTQSKPKRKEPRGLTKKRAIRGPSRLRRVESAAIALEELLSAKFGGASESSELGRAILELRGVLQRKGKSKQTGGPSP
jgi:hypothetical protein